MKANRPRPVRSGVAASAMTNSLTLVIPGGSRPVDKGFPLPVDTSRDRSPPASVPSALTPGCFSTRRPYHGVMTDSEAPAADAAGATEPTPAEGTASATETDDDAYSGLFGAFPYAFRRTESRLCKLYVVVAGLLGGLLAVFFGLALVVQVFNTLSGAGGTFTFSRALFILVGLLVVGPVLAPVLLVARRHRRTSSDVRYDRLLAATGILFLLSLYLGVIASIPPEFVLDRETVTRTPPSGVLAPLIAVLYALPAVASVLIPLTAAGGIYAAHRYAR